MSSTKQIRPGSPEWYLTTDPTKVSKDELFNAVQNNWNKLPQIKYGASGPPTTAMVGDLVLHITGNRLLLREIKPDWAFLNLAEPVYGDVAIATAVRLARTWIRAYATTWKNNPKHGTEAKKYAQIATILESPSSCADIKNYLREELLVKEPNIRKLHKPYELPCWWEGNLGYFSWLDGGLRRLEEAPGRFPRMSGLRFETPLKMVSSERAKASKIWEHTKNLLPEDDADVEYLWELLAYLCTYGNPKEAIVMLMGDGGNGKSTLLYIIKSILGSLAAKGNNNIYALPRPKTFGRGVFRNSVFVYFSEIKPNFRPDIEAMKSDTELSILTEDKHASEEESETIHTSMFISNHEIKIEDDTRAAAGRLHYITTKGKQWRGSDEEIERFSEVLWREEKDVVLTLMVEGYQRLAARGKFALPEKFSGYSSAVKGAGAWKAHSVDLFIQDCVVARKGAPPISPGYVARQAELYAKLNGLVWSNREKDSLSKVMSKMFTRKRFKEGVRYQDVELNVNYTESEVNIHVAGDVAEAVAVEDINKIIDNLNVEGVV